MSAQRSAFGVEVPGWARVAGSLAVRQFAAEDAAAAADLSEIADALADQESFASALYRWRMCAVTLGIAAIAASSLIL